MTLATQIINKGINFATKYVDDAVGVFCRKPKTIELNGLKLAPDVIGDTFKSTSKLNKKAGTIFNTKTRLSEPVKIEDYCTTYSKYYEGLEAIDIEGKAIGRVSFQSTEEIGGLLYPSDKPSVYIDYFGTDANYKGIGTELVREVVKTSKKMGHDGRIRLKACTGSVPTEFRLSGFYERCTTSAAALQYKKMGFKAYDAEIDKLLEQELKSGGNGFVMKNGKIVKDKFAIPMYLSEEAIEKYLNMEFV